MELVKKKEFATAVLDSKNKIFIVHVAAFASFSYDVCLFRQAQMVLLKADETFTVIFTKYIDFVDVFLSDLAAEFLKYIEINNHVINLIDKKQLFYEPIYSLKPVDMKTLKIYIETNLANGFIRHSKSLTGISIFFFQKLDGSFCLYVNYQDLNNLIIKNCYLLPPISKSPDLLDWAKYFTQLDLTNTYH